MRIADQLKDITAALNDWAETEGGSAAVARDKVHLWDLLTLKPGAPRAVVLFWSEKLRGDFGNMALLGRVDRTFLVIVSRGRGFKLNPGDSLTEGAGGGKAMFDLVEGARDVIRALQLDPNTTERPVDFKGIDPFDAGEELRVDAYQIEFSIGTQLLSYTGEPDLASPP